MYAAAGTGICLRPSTAVDLPGRRARRGSCADAAVVRGPGAAEPGPGLAVGPPRRLDRRSSAATPTPAAASPPAPASSTPAPADASTASRTSRSSATAQPYRSADVNFWGVTFAADDNRFYATMSTGRTTGTSSAATSRRAPCETLRGQRRVPVAVARRHPDRVQAGHRRGPDAGLAAVRPRPGDACA